MPKSRQRTAVIAANPEAVVAKKSLHSLTINCKAMKTNIQMQKDPACCEPGSVCCGIDGTGIGCC